MRAPTPSSLATTKKIFRPGLKFKKAGVLMVGLGPANQIQGYLWATDKDWRRRQRLMQVIDGINQRFGRGAIGVAATGMRQTWRMNSQWRSPCYTTLWDELLVALC